MHGRLNTHMGAVHPSLQSMRIPALRPFLERMFEAEYLPHTDTGKPGLVCYKEIYPGIQGRSRAGGLSSQSCSTIARADCSVP